MKQLLVRFLLVSGLMTGASAQAAFIGDFASGDWIKYLSAGSVTTNTADSITLTDEVTFGTKDPVSEAGNVAFDYNANQNIDVCVNNACTTYTGPGSVVLPLQPGDTVSLVSGWENSTTISNLKTNSVVRTNSVPEPATPALIGAGLLLGVTLFRRRKAG